MISSAEPVFFNPLEPGYIENPWPHLAEIRVADPVHRLVTGQWGLFRYEDVFAILRDRDLSVDDRNADLSVLERSALLDEIPEADQNRSMLNMIRSTTAGSGVGQQGVHPGPSGASTRIQEMVDDILDSMVVEGHSDVVERLAFPLPFDVISEMLGMPDADAEQIKHWSAALVKTLDPIITESEIEGVSAGSSMDA